MMRWIVRSSLRLRFLVVALGAVIMLVGAFEVRHTPVDVFPEFAPPTVEIQTECVGLSPAEVEQVVTTPLEQALSGIPGLEQMHSSSISQFSNITMWFKPGTDVLRARELVNEKLTVARPTLPSWAAPPVISEPKSATSRVLMIGITSDHLAPMDLATVAETKIKPRILRVAGIANASIWGNRVLSRQVEVDPVRLRASGLTLDAVLEAASNTMSNGSLRYEPSGKVSTGGFVETAAQRFQVQHAVPVVTPKDVAETIVAVRPDGTKIRVKDVADVVVENPPLIGDAVVNGKSGLFMIVDKFPWGNTRDITKGIDTALVDLRHNVRDVHLDAQIFRPARFIDDAISDLSRSILLGSLLVLFVLALFLFEWRSAVISIITIPISLTASLLVLRLRHATINTMILAGLVIALGAIVDDAIVDIENIVRRLREHRRDGTAVPTARIVLDASLEVRSAVVYASFIEIAALTPIFFLKSLTGSFFRPLAFSYALAVLVSLGVALVVTPALALLLLHNAPLEKRESPLAVRLRNLYGRVLTRVERRPLPAIVASVLIIAIGVFLTPLLGESLFPAFKERDFLIHFVATPGTSLREETRIVTEAEKRIGAISGVRSVGAHIGRATGGEEVNDVNFGEIWVSITEKADYDRTVARIEDVANSYPGVFTGVETYLRERTEEALTGGASDAIVIRIFGPDLDVLRAKAREIDALLGDIPGTSDHHVELEEDIAQVEVQVDLDKARDVGVKPGDVRRAASTLVAGEEVGAVFTENKTTDVFVWGTANNRNSPDAIREMRIDTANGSQVRLGDIARVQLVPVPNVIRHENGSRRIDVGTQVAGRDLGAVARDIRKAVDDVALPPGHHVEVLGEYKERSDATSQVRNLALVAALAVFLLLRASFHRWRLAVLAFVTLPIALIGGELAVFAFADRTISLGSLVGFFTVLGIVARNGIMMISHYHHLETEEGMEFGPALVVRGAQERLAPILMTGLATGLGLIPLVITGNVPGQEIEYPLAIVILGGLVASALLNLFLLPTLYLRFAKPRRASAVAPDPA